jgi:hypothetical protein
MAKSSGRQAVEALKLRLEEPLRRFDTPEASVSLGSEVWLSYAREVMGYGEPAQNPENNQYRLDLVVFDLLAGGRTRIPRVAIEFKLDTVTTNDALAYNEKARSYRLIYPYLRCSLVKLNWGKHSLPARLVRATPDLAHIGVIQTCQPTDDEIGQLVAHLGEEIEASRNLQTLLLENLKSDKTIFRCLRRKLLLGCS